MFNLAFAELMQELFPVKKQKFAPRPAGLPASVANGCVPKTIMLPVQPVPARRRDGTLIHYHHSGKKCAPVYDHPGMSNKVWKQKLNELKRERAGRWYSGKKASS
jgi:hypothetical protein